MSEIKQIVGIEPGREGEYPFYYLVGADGVTLIDYSVTNYGDHGIGEFLVYKGTKLFVKVTHRAVSQILYFLCSENIEE